MIRWSVLTAGAAVVAGAAWVTGSTDPGRSPAEAPKQAEGKVFVGQKIGFFNMAKVMRHYERAQTSVARLNERRVRMTANLVGMRAMLTEKQAALQKETQAVPNPLDRAVWNERDLQAKALVGLARKIEDLDREISKLLNDQATIIIGELYDEVHAVVAEVAKEHGLSAVLAYPDAVTPDEAANPHVKELKLKPPAAHPFYLDPAVDYTDELLQRLNAKFAAGEK